MWIVTLLPRELIHAWKRSWSSFSAASVHMPPTRCCSELRAFKCWNYKPINVRAKYGRNEIVLQSYKMRMAARWRIYTFYGMIWWYTNRTIHTPSFLGIKIAYWLHLVFKFSPPIPLCNYLALFCTISETYLWSS